MAPNTDALHPEYNPDTIHNRKKERRYIANTIRQDGSDALHVYGPHGSGKTITVRAALAETGHTIHHVNCRTHDTANKIFRHLYYLATGDELTANRRTDQLQELVHDHLNRRNAVIILDDIDFLLEHGDPEPVFAFLTSLPNTPSIVTISANHDTIFTEVDPRAFKNLHPKHLHIPEYNHADIIQILQNHVDSKLPSITVDEDALGHIATITRDASLAISWLGWTASTADDRITKEDVKTTYSGAVQLYWDWLLTDFTEHHSLLIEAVCELDAQPNTTVYTGDVYRRYQELCTATRVSPRTRRRVSDLLTDLEHLGIVNAVYHDGGEHGATREITVSV